MITGRINSIQSLGTVDGPGVRYVVFMQGCNLRCGCCHNPDTWENVGGEMYSASDIVEKVIRYTPYFGSDGGITVSGGEPLLQPEFVQELFSLCKEKGINTCLDTSGSIINDAIKDLLKVTDRVLLDIKYTNETDYVQYVGCSYSKPINFLKLLDEMKIPTILRQVIIPTLNDDMENIELINELIDRFGCIESIELLPFKKLCKSKYESLNIPFRFSDFSEPSRELMKTLNQKLYKR